MLSEFLLGLLNGDSIRAAFARLPVGLALETFYSIRRRFIQHTAELRTLLSRLRPPPPCPQSEPWRHTMAHLQSVFPDPASGTLAHCLLSAFQLRFQKSVLG